MKKTPLGCFMRNNIRSISAKQRINFFRQMAILTKAGVTLLNSLHMLHRSSKGPIKRLIGDAIVLVEQGNDFSLIGKYYVKFFDRTIASMIRAGEQTGSLPEVMQQIFDNLTRSFAFKRKVQGAMMMPILTLLFAVGVVFFLSLYVIPQFAGFLENMGAELPPITRFVVDLSNYIVAHWKDLLIYAA
jgi:type IV pilus assembly protein PilC